MENIANCFSMKSNGNLITDQTIEWCLLQVTIKNCLLWESFAEGLGLGLQGLYSATIGADNILGRFKIILQNQIARVDSFTNLTAEVNLKTLKQQW